MSASFGRSESKKWNGASTTVLAVALLLLAGIALIYVKARQIPLISDDYVDLLDLSDWGFFSKARTFFRPLVKLYFESLTPLLGMNPAGYHVLSQFIHWLNALLLFAFCRHFFKLKNPQGNRSERDRETRIALMRQPAPGAVRASRWPAPAAAGTARSGARGRWRGACPRDGRSWRNGGGLRHAPGHARHETLPGSGRARPRRPRA